MISNFRPDFIENPRVATGKLAWVIDHDWQVGLMLIGAMVATIATLFYVITVGL